MKSFLTPLVLAFSIPLSLILAAFLFIAFYGFGNLSFGIIISSVIVFFILASLLVASVLKSRITQPLKEIFSFVHRQRSNATATPEVLDEEIIPRLRNEITEWSEERKREIENQKKLETYRKEFLGNVSHELKTPIFNIQGYLLTLIDGGLSDPSINLSYLQKAEGSVERMINIIEDLESISQLEVGSMELEMESFDIIGLAKEVAEAQEMQAKGKKISLRVKEEAQPIFVIADRFRTRQIFTNLIVNSIKYGKENGETKMKFYDTGNKIVAEVEDNGIGIAKEHLPRVFERFYRADKSRSRELGGTGLGLSIVKHIVEAHNQTITVNSTEGVGSVFSFTLKKG